MITFRCVLMDNNGNSLWLEATAEVHIVKFILRLIQISIHASFVPVLQSKTVG